MTQPDKKDLPASIHQRLLNRAKETHRPFTEILQYYAIERFLYRLSQSPYEDRFILKGALIFTAWGGPVPRATRDIDLLARIHNDLEQITMVFRALCSQAVEPDGLIFDQESVAASTIKEQDLYQGLRVRFLDYLARTRVNMQADIGFEDVVTPRPVLVNYPTLLDLPSPRLHGYTRETVAAEKLHAVATLGQTNTRMKDFFDLWVLSETSGLNPEDLKAAIDRTFARRRTALPQELPIALLPQFARDKQTQWQAFIETNDISGAPASLALVVESIVSAYWDVMRKSDSDA